MKKIATTLMFCLLTSISTFAAENRMQTDFTRAIKNCDKYSKEGSAKFNGEEFDIAITLDNTKKGCMYKEKIFQGKDYQQLTCNFSEKHLKFINDSMERYSAFFKKEIAKNPIFEAKLTTNGEIFQQYLINPEICKITYSKKKANP